MTEDEIAVMDGGKCILQLRGVRPFFSDKYDITKHPNYKYLSDYDKKNTFDMENPSNMVYMIAGVRGSGKTVSLAVIGDHYNAKEDWIRIAFKCRYGSDFRGGIGIKPNSEIRGIDLGININIGIAEIAFNKERDTLDKETMLRDILEKVKEQGKKVLFIIDEIINNQYVKLFVSNFQIYITKNYPVYLVMAGLYDNISNLQNEKSLTFFIPRSQNISGTIKHSGYDYQLQNCIWTAA